MRSRWGPKSGDNNMMQKDNYSDTTRAVLRHAIAKLAPTLTPKAVEGLEKLLEDRTFDDPDAVLAAMRPNKEGGDAD